MYKASTEVEYFSCLETNQIVSFLQGNLYMLTKDLVNIVLKFMLTHIIED
jgi:hypothetical protein